MKLSEKNHLGDISKVSASYILIQCLQDSKICSCRAGHDPLVLVDLWAGPHPGSTAVSLAGKLFPLRGRYATRRRTAPSSQLVAQGTTLSKQQPAGVLTSEMWPRLLPQIGGAYSWAGSCVSTPHRGAWPFRCARLVAGDQLVCAPLTWAGARHRRMAASRKPPRVR